MKKKISFSGKGQRADIGDMTIYRILPNRYATSVGPFVFLDHIAPKVHAADAKAKKGGTGEHPHRGIATLTYILHGEGEHFDSAGNYAKVTSGGIQWMKAGYGIVHDENLLPDPKDKNRLTHAFQFWINLPAKNKAEPPKYLALQAHEVPKRILDDHTGWVKVIVGAYENLSSSIPDYSKQFAYHLHLEAGKHFSLNTENGLEYAAFLPENNVTINDSDFKAGDFIEFDRSGGVIEIVNPNTTAADIILFGGEHYAEPIAAEGPFVMNSRLEVADAYKDFFAGKYGKINYP